MVTAEEIKRLAKLARIEVSQGEEEALRKDIDGILAYVGEIKKVSIDKVSDDLPVKNVFRDDVSPLPTGELTEALVGSAPKSQGDYIKVKKIL